MEANHFETAILHWVVTYSCYYLLELNKAEHTHTKTAVEKKKKSIAVTLAIYCACFRYSSSHNRAVVLGQRMKVAEMKESLWGLLIQDEQLFSRHKLGFSQHKLFTNLQPT